MGFDVHAISPDGQVVSRKVWSIDDEYGEILACVDIFLERTGLLIGEYEDLKLAPSQLQALVESIEEALRRTQQSSLARTLLSELLSAVLAAQERGEGLFFRAD